jgi:hypothetical protein
VTILAAHHFLRVWVICLDLNVMTKVGRLACYYHFRLGVRPARLMRVARLKQSPPATKGKSDMPKVGKKEFPYTPKGMAMAKAAAKKSGKKKKKK